jgi:effector-binding domain-containing protein
MRLFKFITYITVFLVSVYALSMLFVDESKQFTIEKEINYPVDKVFPQFNNLQNFAQWSAFFQNKENYSLSFYTPYEGQGSSMSFQNPKNKSDFGDLFIRYSNLNSTLKYQLFEGVKKSPYQIDVKFFPQNNKTKVVWFIHTPRQPLLKRSLNLITEDYVADNIESSMQKLSQLLGGKVDREIQLSKIKYDTLLIEKDKDMLLLGINVSTNNKKGNAIKSIELNHNKVINFVTKDFNKKEDEFGLPILITEASGYKNKEISYFYGVPLKKKQGLTDNNFSYRTLNPSDYYVMYYKGSYDGRVKVITQLLNQAKKDSMRNGYLQETFLESPDSKKEVKIKLSLPVFR